MRATFFHFLIIVFALACAQQVKAQIPFELVNETDRIQINKAIALMDNGKPEEAVKILDDLCNKYKDNYTIEYERLYARYKAGDFKRVVKDGMKLFKHPDVESQCYQIVGNAQDMLGNRKEAIKTYEEGLKHFPNSGSLYLEKGNIYFQQQQYNEAVDSYSRGVEVEPDFASNYYRLAKLYANSTEPLWAIIYGEVVCNLLPGTKRCAEMGKLIYDLFCENVKVEDENKIHVSLTQENTVYMARDTSRLQIPFPLLYERGLLKSSAIGELLSNPKLTVAQIADLRKGALTYIDSMAPGYYNISLLDLHRNLIKSGNWTAYNMWLMSTGAEDETKQWAETKEGDEQLEAFANWFVSNRLIPSVAGPTLMTRIYKIEELDIPDKDEISTAAGCRKHRDDALRLAKWLLAQPTNTTGVANIIAIQFLMKWMENTDEYAFSLRGIVAFDNKDLMTAYIAAMVEHAIEFNVHKPDEAMYCEVMLQVVEYYKRNKDVLGIVEPMEKYLNMDGPTLRDTLSEEYNQGTK